MTDQRSRGWTWTLNNYTEEEIKAIDAIECQYLIYGKEIGEKGTPHLQGYIYFKNAITFKSIKRKLPVRCHIEKSKGSPQENTTYCSKDGNTTVRGKEPIQGFRTDLKELADKILKRQTTVDTIVQEDPLTYHQYGRTLEKLEDLAQRKIYRTEMTKCDWITGHTGAGKSHKAFENFTPETHYVYNTEDKGWWDGYKGQDTVIINDFKGEIKYGTLLQLIDKWPMTVPRRNREPIPFTSKKIIITAINTPERTYKNLSTGDGIDQLLRRVNIIDLTPNTQVLRGNTHPEHPYNKIIFCGEDKEFVYDENEEDDV